MVMHARSDRRGLRAALLANLVAFCAAVPLAAQDRGPYLDADAEALHASARGAWQRIERDLLSYTAVVKQRVAANLRLPLKDRTLYHQETASRVFWSRDGGILVQALGVREWHPGYEFEDPDPRELLGDGLMDNAFDPASDRLVFGLSDGDDEDDVWFFHPLGDEAVEHYRFRTGDTLVLRLPERDVRAVELQVLPVEADIHRIAGSLWIEPEEGALVRAVYRLSQPINVERDFPGEIDDEDLRWVPGLFRPFTFELSIVAVEYGLWDFEVWLPRSMRVEGQAAAGVVKVPAFIDMSYQMESVLTEKDLAEAAPDEVPGDAVEEHHFRTRSEAMDFLAERLTENGTEFVRDGRTSRRNGRSISYFVPEDPARILDSPHLPPPIWDDAIGFPSEERLEEMFATLADLPLPARDDAGWLFVWGQERPDLLRYNRVEGPSVGARAQRLLDAPFGPTTFEAEGFLGVADLEPKVRLSLERESLRNRVTLGAYRELQAVSPRDGHLGFGNSVTSLLFGRDDGEYFLASGADLRVSPPSARRQSWEVRLYAEHHEAVERNTDFTVAHIGDGDWNFRPNIVAEQGNEFGAQVRLSPWWGTDPLASQWGVEVVGTAATGDAEYARAETTLRGVVPLFGGRIRTGLELSAGESWGDPPLQRSWFLGSVSTLRGYDASTLVGTAFARARLEVGRVFPVGTFSVFSDAGWAGGDLGDFASDRALVSIGLGASLLDGLIRLDVARGLRDPKMTRWDFYLDAIL